MPALAGLATGVFIVVVSALIDVTRIQGIHVGVLALLVNTAVAVVIAALRPGDGG